MYETMEITRERVATYDGEIEVPDLELGNSKLGLEAMLQSPLLNPDNLAQIMDCQIIVRICRKMVINGSQDFRHT